MSRKCKQREVAGQASIKLGPCESNLQGATAGCSFGKNQPMPGGWVYNDIIVNVCMGEVSRICIHSWCTSAGFVISYGNEVRQVKGLLMVNLW
jgi:hypothetical protein